MGATRVFAPCGLLASLLQPFLRLVRLIFTFLLRVMKPCSVPPLKPGVEKGVLLSALLMHPCVLAGFLGLGHGVHLWCVKTP